MSEYVGRQVSVALSDDSGYFVGSCSDWFSDGIEISGAVKHVNSQEIDWGRVFLPWHAVNTVTLERT